MRFRFVLLAVAVLALSTDCSSGTTEAAEARSTPEESKTRLGIAGSQFTVNGKPTFLYGVSYYGALGARRPFVIRDLDDMQRQGVNWIRWNWRRWRSWPPWPAVREWTETLRR